MKLAIAAIVFICALAGTHYGTANLRSSILHRSASDNSSCATMGLFNPFCSALNKTSNCLDICGGNETAIKTVEICVNKPEGIFKIGDTVKGVASLQVDHPPIGNLYYDLQANFTGGRESSWGNGVCGSSPEYCHTTNLKINITAQIPDTLTSYIGDVQGRLVLRDGVGPILCLNGSGILEK
ncbi:uncharacterized protein LOC134192598 [Corticium candelabrum]|uniref:uncharacterized protein LOC134192598 n=1 Tax=Corticium candelabrum TaxID=121492 RepID=UPI002E25A0D3|nr:uncharacterized protein LOC134192598 [Corticium candelabrum]